MCNSHQNFNHVKKLNIALDNKLVQQPGGQTQVHNKSGLIVRTVNSKYVIWGWIWKFYNPF